MVDQLNQQKCTTHANEQAYVLTFNKDLLHNILEKGLKRNFERVLEFMQSLEIFKDCELPIMLPLANGVQWKKYSLGEYIIKEGDIPKGLYMLVSGQCKVGSEKLNIRSKQTIQYEKFKPAMKPIIIKGNNQDTYIREFQRNRERIVASDGPLKERMSLD